MAIHTYMCKCKCGRMLEIDTCARTIVINDFIAGRSEVLNVSDIVIADNGCTVNCKEHFYVRAGSVRTIREIKKELEVNMLKM
jgi:hypothetical protein